MTPNINSEDLFTNIPPMKSPRLAWMEKHGITVATTNASTGRIIRARTARTIGPVCSTEDDALCGLAGMMGIRMWNEEGLP